MEDNTLRKSLANLSAAWLLPLEIIELLLIGAHPKDLVSFALTCKELLDYILKNESHVVLKDLWWKSYCKHINLETTYDKLASRKYYLLRVKSLNRIARSMKFEIEDGPDEQKLYAPVYDPHGTYNPKERVEIEPEARNWNQMSQHYHYDWYNVDFYLKQYKTLTPAEKLAVAKYSSPQKTRHYKMPNLDNFSTYSIFMIAQWLARKATVHCMSKRGEYIQPTLLHDLSCESSLDVIILAVLFRQEELYRALIKEYSWCISLNGETSHQDPQFREQCPHLIGAIENQITQRFRDTYTCRIVDWPKVHRDNMRQVRESLASKSKELEAMFGISSPSNQ